MPDKKADQRQGKLKLKTEEQVSSGGVAFRQGKEVTEVAQISVGKPARWQLPKGIVDTGETPEITAVREVKEEAGISTELLQKIDTIEYWYVGDKGKQRVRFHKFVHFYLLAYKSGDIRKHDWEVNEARWVKMKAAKDILSFKTERQIVEKVESMVAKLNE